eukprot:714033_1
MQNLIRVWSVYMLATQAVLQAQRLTDAEKQEILDQHNELRSQAAKRIGASDMQVMAWSSELENFAVDYLDSSSCTFEHSGGPYGENLAVGNFRNISRVVDLWYSEEALWISSNSATCCTPGTGHYTQVIWANSNAIGCASCNSVYICEYRNPGNFIGRPPSIVGQTECSACPDSLSMCDRSFGGFGLCTDSENRKFVSELSADPEAGSGPSVLGAGPIVGIVFGILSLFALIGLAEFVRRRHKPSIADDRANARVNITNSDEFYGTDRRQKLSDSDSSFPKPPKDSYNSVTTTSSKPGDDSTLAFFQDVDLDEESSV